MFCIISTFAVPNMHTQPLQQLPDDPFTVQYFKQDYAGLYVLFCFPATNNSSLGSVCPIDT